MTKIVAYIFLILTTVFEPHAQSLKKGDITVKVEGIKNVKGQIILTLYDEPEGFPTKPDLAFRMYVLPVQGLTVTAVLDNLPYGEYAIGVFQDENMDGEFNTNFLGFPKEKAGASNNLRALFIPPFAKAKFELSEKSITKKINIK